MNPDTIVAPATPPGRGGVSLIRLSGPTSKHIAKKITGLNSLKNRRSLLTAIQGVGGVIDDVLIVFFKKPSSYTGEDVIEISCHGNPNIVDCIIELILEKGARLADPGEFTKRAFLNGKLDLIQAESVAALIASKSKAAASMNQRALAGKLSTKINNLRNSLVTLLSRIEFELDISEHDTPDKNLPEILHKSLNDNILKTQQLLESFEEGKLYNSGARVVIFGAPNVGKSTLLNSLVRKDRAITSQTPGTTRDTIDADIVLDGIPVVLVDTAGVRQTREGVEGDGVRRSFDEIRKADLVIYVYCDNDSESYLIDYIIDMPHIVVFNKVDLSENPIQTNGVFSISALRGDGVDDVRKEIPKFLKNSINSGSDDVLTTRRQVRAISGSNKKITAALTLLKNTEPQLEIIALEIRDAIAELDALLGKTTVDDVLGQMFSDFCVGK